MSAQEQKWMRELALAGLVLLQSFILFIVRMQQRVYAIGGIDFIGMLCLFLANGYLTLSYTIDMNKPFVGFAFFLLIFYLSYIASCHLENPTS